MANLTVTTRPLSAMRHQLTTIILPAADIKITSESSSFCFSEVLANLLMFLAPLHTNLTIPAILKGILKIIGSHTANRLTTDKLHKTLPTRPEIMDMEIMVS